uniref:Jun-like transcription factor domain-containing protein n=1 Tax=Macaca fascicularis TaxID=9541 RepID=A0A7N9C8X5_MACFA
ERPGQLRSQQGAGSWGKRRQESYPPGARGPGPEGGGGGSYFSGQGSDTGASLKLASSELERLIVPNSNGVITTTPTPPGQYFYPRGGGSGGGAGGAGGGVTEEQEGFADGFVKALDDLHKMNHVTPPNVSLGASGGPGWARGRLRRPGATSRYTPTSAATPASRVLGRRRGCRRDRELIPDGHHQLPPTRATLRRWPPGAAGLEPQRLHL